MPRHLWHDGGGLRHAYDTASYPFPPRPGEEITVLCGAEVTLVREDFPQLPEHRKHPTCWECDAAWRRREGLAPRPAVAKR
ncbi:zinc finger protein [Saccharothrix texasensis]|uniref:Zinc finger protein n=1 Tax=Saccharothrix texasensis TaxID=103734 RepID=A0A3N1H4L5_9PSEU|nr:zinc finger protein [Saccharothrix texasensis]ROP37428.1 zinc finger protein [Saccharothrix texasensis]